MWTWLTYLDPNLSWTQISLAGTVNLPAQEQSSKGAKPAKGRGRPGHHRGNRDTGATERRDIPQALLGPCSSTERRETQAPCLISISTRQVMTGGKLWKSTGDKVVVPAQTLPKKATLPYDEGLSAARSPSSKRALCDGTEHLGYLSSPTTGFPKSH